MEHPSVPRDVLNAAIAHAGEIRRYYPHGDRDFRTDVSYMLAEALEVLIDPLGEKAVNYRDNPCAEVPPPLLASRRPRTPNQGRDSLSEGGN